MRIRINNELIDFSLERERTLGEVVACIDSWLGGNGFCTTALRLDGKLIAGTGENGDAPEHGDDTWKATPIDTVGDLEVTAETTRSVVANNLAVLHEHFSLLQRAVGARDLPVLEEYRSSLPFMFRSLENALSDTGKKDVVVDRAESIFREFGLHPDAASIPLGSDREVETLVRTLESLVTIIRDRMAELLEPASEMKRLLPALELVLRSLEETPVLLQTGRDREAFESIIRFFELSQKLLRLLRMLHDDQVPGWNSMVIEGQHLDAFYTELNGVLTELAEAFESGDSVLIGDLLEYEVAPRTLRFLEAARRVA